MRSVTILEQLSLTTTFLVVVSVTVATFLLWTIISSVRARLSNVPGPWHARYTNMWMVYIAWKNRTNEQRYAFYKNLKSRYGDVVRIGPKTVVVLDPFAVPTIYGVRTRLDKGEAYKPLQQTGSGQSLITMLDEDTHSKYKRLVSNAYSMSSLKGYEPYVDDILRKFTDVLDRFAAEGERMNLSLWYQSYAFDVVSKITFGKSLGFLDGRDPGDFITRVEGVSHYVAPVSQAPWLHKILSDNPVVRRTRPSPFLKLVSVAVRERLMAKALPEEGRPDLLAHFAATHAANPAVMDENYILTSTSGNIIAGGLSPGRAFDTLCEWLALHPEGQDRLYREVTEACTTFPAPFDAVKNLPYLNGVIMEAYRLHTSTSVNLQRVTGSDGLQLPNGVRLPPRINVGCPSSHIDRDPRVFGDDAELFVPERWLPLENESQEAYTKRKNLMTSVELSFGQGSRSCLGKNVAVLEFFKAVATISGQYRFKALTVPKKREVWVTVTKRERDGVSTVSG